MDLMTNWTCTLSSVERFIDMCHGWLCYTGQIKQILKEKHEKAAEEKYVVTEIPIQDIKQLE